MALAKDYEIIQVEIDPSTADAFLKINLIIADNGIAVFKKIHRIAIPVAMPLPQARQMIDQILTQAGYPVLVQADLASLGAIFNAARANKGKAKLPDEVATSSVLKAPMAPPPPLPVQQGDTNPPPPAPIPEPIEENPFSPMEPTPVPTPQEQEEQEADDAVAPLTEPFPEPEDECAEPEVELPYPVVNKE